MNYFIIMISITILIIDQLTKSLACIYLPLNKSNVLINNFFSLTLTNNYGAAFGIFKNNIVFLVLVSLVILIVLYKYMHSFKRNKRNNIAFGLLLGGIFGNLIDRIIKGYVIDFLDFKIFNYDFPVFNFSDVAIFLGIVLLCYAIIKKEDNCGNK